MRSDRFRHLLGALHRRSEPNSRRPRRSKRRRDNSRSLESLEPRIVLAGDVIIAEVMTKNDKSLSDEDGSSSDWLEIYNSGKAQADLTGWHLTDQRNDRTKWTLPATLLHPGESLLVFASGKDRTDPESELHTNFRIGDNSYLALMEADGRTVADEFDPLPVQYTDVSYGVEQSFVLRDVVSVGDTVSVLMPASAGEDVPTANWTSADYDDAGWGNFTSGLGFDDDPNDGDFSPLINANGDLSSMQGQTASAYVRAEFDLPADALPIYESMELAVNYDDGFIAYLNGQEIARVSAPDDPAWDSTATAEHGGIGDERHYPDFSNADDRDDFTLNGDAQWVGNALRLTAPAVNQTASAFGTNAIEFGEDYTFSASMSFDIHSPGGQFPIGGEGLTFVLQSNDENILGSGQGGLGLANTGSTFVAIELDSVATGAFDPDDSLASHLGVITSTAGSVERVAVPRFNGDAFFAGQPGPGENLIFLWVDYDGATNQLDVYLHDADEKPADPTLSTAVNLAEMFDGSSAYGGWTSSTSDRFNGHDVLSFDIITGIGEIGRETEYFDVSDHVDALKTGTNVLAIHGLNVDAADEDFLIVPQLSLNEVNLGEVLYFSQPTPGTFNGDGTMAPSVAVTFSHDSRAFVDPFQLEITADAANAAIRYTLDGSLPDVDSMLYTGPINVDGPMRIRARAFEPDRGPGPITTAGFIQLDDSLVNFENNEVFNSNLPVIVLDSFGQRAINSDAARLVPSVGLFIDPGEDGRAGLLDEPEYAGRAGVRIRGQSSQSWAKKQYALEFWEEGNDDSDRLFAYEAEDKNVSLFGLPLNRIGF